MKTFEKPIFEMIRFNDNVIATSSCGCYDADLCPVDYKDCLGDGAGCECEINHNPALGNCTPCGQYQ